MQYQRGFSKIRWDKAENSHQITAEVQGNYPKFKQNLAMKEIFVISKVSGSQPLLANTVAEHQSSKTLQLADK